MLKKWLLPSQEPELFFCRSAAKVLEDGSDDVSLHRQSSTGCTQTVPGPVLIGPPAELPPKKCTLLIYFHCYSQTQAVEWS